MCRNNFFLTFSKGFFASFHDCGKNSTTIAIWIAPVKQIYETNINPNPRIDPDFRL